ncbi:MAG: M56 family metallopeptidase [Planctomycetaceae bacterium]
MSVCFSLRLIVGWANTFRVRCMGLSDVSVNIQSVCEKLSATMAVRSTVRVCESTLVQVPVVVGWLRPLILLPACLLSGLSEQQLRAILAHELAHVRRHDYAVNFVQILIENLLFYHPAIWWLSKQIRQERENCCDDIAAAVSGGNRVLARALATLAELHVTAPQTLPAATGGSLVNRIRRLVGTEARPDKMVSDGLGVGIVVGVFFFLAMAMLFHSPSGSADESGPTSSQSNTSGEVNAKEPDSATPASEEPELEQTASAEPSSDVTFDDLYRIPEGRVLHRVPLPLTPSARKRYEAAVGPQQVAAMPDGPSGVIWKFDGKETKIHKAAFGGGDGQSLFTLVELLADVEMCELEGTASLWLTKISADFVLRSGAQQDQIISDLQRILKDELNLNVSLKFEDAEREVLVASGNFVGKPAGPSLQYQAKPRSPYLLYGETQSGHPLHDMGKYPDFWKAVSLRVGRRVVDESKNAPEDYLQWLLSYDHPETTIWDTIPPRQFSANADVALDRLREQTGLRFEAGSRRIRVLTLQANPLAKAGALNSSGSLARRSQAASSNDRRSLETSDSDKASARPERFPLKAWNRLP